MAYGPVDLACGKGCTAMFADSRERNDHEDTCKSYTVYAADRSGETFNVMETYDPSEALKALEQGRNAKPHLAVGVYETDDPERGDVEMELEDLR